MHRRTFLKTGLKTGAAAGLAVAAPYVARGAGPLVMRWAHFAQEDHPANLAAKQFAAKVEARTAGAIQVKIFANNVLGGPAEQAQQVKLGTIDMGLPTQGQLDKYELAFAAVMLPFVFDSPAHVYRTLDGPAMAWLAPLAEAQGFVLLRNWDYGFRNVTNSQRAINAPDDMKGLRIRTPPELQIQASMEAVDAIVLAIPFPELYLALSQKVVEGEENPIAVIW
jgi:tripartite ATP-independent transporter DctP family solute receptor